MKHLTLGRMDRFACVGGACPYTCCAGGWRITIDPESDAFYQSVAGEYGKTLNKTIDRNRTPASFILDGQGRCPQLDENNLCRVYQELGRDKLCDTCKFYPRMEFAAGDTLLHWLTLSCPEVGRRILAQKEPLSLNLSEEPGRRINNPEKIDWQFVNFALQSMITGVNLLQDRNYTVRTRQQLFLIFHRAVQDAVDQKNMDKAHSVLEVFSEPGAYAPLARDTPVPADHMAAKVRMFRELSELFLTKKMDVRVTPQFLTAVNYILSGQADFDAAAECLRRYDAPDGQIQQEQILVYTLFSHYLKDLLFVSAEKYRRDLYRQAVFAVLFNQISRMFMAFASANAGREFSVDEQSLLLSWLSRYFDHSSVLFRQNFDTVITRHGFLDTGFLFRILS